MANKKTRALTVDEYNQIIDTMRTGFSGCRPNDRIATALIIEANLGIRISDILNLKLSDIRKQRKTETSQSHLKFSNISKFIA